MQLTSGVGVKIQCGNVYNVLAQCLARSAQVACSHHSEVTMLPLSL